MLSACAGMRPDYETPTVSVQAFRSVPSNAGGGLPSFEIDLHVVNPNLDALELAGVSYTVALNGHEVIKGVSNELPVIEGYGEDTFTVTAAFDLLAGIQLFRSLLNDTGSTVDYAFEAKLDPGPFRRKIRVRDTGRISLSGSR